MKIKRTAGGKLPWFYQTDCPGSVGGYSRGLKKEKSKSLLFPNAPVICNHTLGRLAESQCRCDVVLPIGCPRS